MGFTMVSKNLLIHLFIAFTAFMPTLVLAQTTTPFFLFRPQERLELHVQIQTLEGQNLNERQLRISFNDHDGNQKLLAEILQPASLRSMKFLRIQEGNQTQMWVKTSRGTRRIAPGSRPEPIFNSVFTTGDFDLDNTGWSLVQESRQTQTRTRLQASTGFTQELVTRSLDGLVLTLTNKDSEGQSVREYRVTEWDNGGEEKGYPNKVEVKDVKSGRTSMLSINSFREPASWPRNAFSSGAL